MHKCHLVVMPGLAAEAVQLGLSGCYVTMMRLSSAVQDGMHIIYASSGLAMDAAATSQHLDLPLRRSSLLLGSPRLEAVPDASWRPLASCSSWSRYAA